MGDDRFCRFLRRLAEIFILHLMCEATGHGYDGWTLIIVRHLAAQRAHLERARQCGKNIRSINHSLSPRNLLGNVLSALSVLAKLPSDGVAAVWAAQRDISIQLRVEDKVGRIMEYIARKTTTSSGDRFEPHKLSFFSMKSWSPQVVAPVWSPRIVVSRHFKMTLPSLANGSLR